MIWNTVVHPKAAIEINELPNDMKAKLVRTLELMQQLGPINMGEPHIKSLGNKLWEIRLKGRDGIARVIYCIFSHKKIGILHAFIKKTQKTSKQNMECALKRLKEI